MEMEMKCLIYLRVIFTIDDRFYFMAVILNSLHNKIKESKCIALNCNVHYNAVLFCRALFCIALHRIALLHCICNVCTPLHYIVSLHFIATVVSLIVLSDSPILTLC